jgi:hypothetical protein
VAVIRQQAFYGQQRVDVGHLRSVEAGVAGDLDVLAGIIMAGKTPEIVDGFDVVLTGAIGSPATSLVINVAGSSVIHFEASESGSIFRAPEDRSAEVLNSSNPRVVGSFTPSTTNFLGIDLKRSSDDTTADTVQFLDSDTKTEMPVVVPLARTLDYRFVISTTEFSATPGVCPIAKVVTNASNQVVSVEDARNLYFRLGCGGSSPQSVNPFGWPGGRNESNATTSAVAGDRSIKSLKGWMDAIMSRIWEIGGGEFWYSATADRNVRISANSVFTSTGEPFEIVSSNVHWKGLIATFDNSTGNRNEIANQTTSSPGLTDLADGECLYVDIDRTQNLTGVNAIRMQKGVLANLGMSSRPGQRYAVVWRIGSFYYTRDQYLPVGSSMRVATTAANGVVRLSATPGSSLAPIVATATSGNFMGMSGFSRNNTGTTGNLSIGLGASAGDHDIQIYTDGTQYNTTVTGANKYSTNQKAALKVSQLGATGYWKDARIFECESYLGGSNSEVKFSVESDGAVGLAIVNEPPAAPAPTAFDTITNKVFVRKSRYWHTAVRVATHWADALSATPSGPAGAGHILTGGLVTLVIDGVTVSLNDRVLYKDPGGSATSTDIGIYTVTQLGSTGVTAWKMTRATDADDAGEVQHGLSVPVTAGTANAGTLWEMTDENPVVMGTTSFNWRRVFVKDYREQACIMWSNGKISILAESDPVAVA